MNFAEVKLAVIFAGYWHINDCPVFGIERVICNYWLSFVDEILEVGLKVGIDSFCFSAILIEWELTMISSSK